MSGLPTIVHASQAPGGQQCFTQLVHAHQNGLRTELWTLQKNVDGRMLVCVDTLDNFFTEAAFAG